MKKLVRCLYPGSGSRDLFPCLSFFFLNSSFFLFFFLLFFLNSSSEWLPVSSQ